MVRKYFKIILLVWLVAVFILPRLVLAEGNPALDKLQNIGTINGPYASADEFGLSQIIGIVIQAALGLVGAIFLVLMLYAGYNWMIARGDEEKVTKAKDTITRAIIGIIIVVGAYAIWAYVFEKIF